MYLSSISGCLMIFRSMLSKFSSQPLTIEMNLGIQVDRIIDLAGVKHAKVVLAVCNPNEKVDRFSMISFAVSIVLSPCY